MSTLEERSPHRVISASAGTGKTHTLAIEFLRRVARHGCPEEILATTFTRKAAGEILERVLVRLAEAVIDEDRRASLLRELGCGADVALVSMLELMCRRLHRLQIGTLDSFFHRALRVWRYELGISQLSAVVAIDSAEARSLRRGALQRALADLSESDLHALVDLVSRLYRGQAVRSVAVATDRVFVELLDLTTEAPAASVWTSLGKPSGVLEESDLAVALHDLGAMVGSPLLNGNENKALVSDLERLQEEDWLAFLSKGLGKAIRFNSGLYYKRELAGSVNDAYQPLVRHASACLVGLLAEQGQATHSLMTRLAAHFRAAARGEGVLLFSDLSRLLAEHLGKLPDERRMDLEFRLDARVRDLLIDEFQDTSGDQWRCLEPLAHEILAWGDGSRFFLAVGDAKQSIYGWRGGRPELFEHVQALVGQENVEHLSKSYRSAPVVLQAVNRVFASLLDNAAIEDGFRATAVRWSRHFVLHESAWPQMAGYVVLRTSERWEGAFDVAMEQTDDDFDPDEVPQPVDHLGWVARYVSEIVRRRPRAEIGVLVATNRAAAEIVSSLLTAGVAASGEGGSFLVDDPVVLTLLSLLRLADHPGDTVAAYHVCSTALGQSIGMRSLSDAPRVAAAWRLAFCEEGVALCLARLVARALPRLAGRCQRRVQQFLAATEELEPIARGRFSRLATLLAERRIEEPSAAKVRVMTVHRAKGLEFDVVVLGELERRLANLLNPLVYVQRDTPLDPPCHVYRSTNRFVRELAPQLVPAFEQEVERRLLDDLGMLYVGLTRARGELHLVVQPLAENAKGEGKDQASLLRNALAETDLAGRKLGNRVLFAAGAPIVENAEHHEAEVGGTAQRAPWRAPTLTSPDQPDRSARGGQRGAHPRLATSLRPCLMTNPSGMRSSADQPVRRTEWPWSSGILDAGWPNREDQAARRRGELAHAILALLEWLPLTRPIDELAAPLWRQYRCSVAEREALLADVTGWIEGGALQGVLADPTDGSTQVVLWRERSFALEGEAGVLLTGAFDRVHLFRRGQRWLGAEVFDWKTGAAGGSAEAALAIHGPQVVAYMEALARLLGVLPTAIRGRLVLLDRNEVVEVSSLG